ncbi:MAG TPA: mechanosensitive ion channel family protein, partial [Burkholderiaceae bacterium]|nr:mechanosensitive ion channel family protein [Burkholderiaceae bacterium]
ENRARTLSSVFHNAATTVIYLGALLIILDEVGIPISTLLGGVAVIGLAVAFGAQNLIKDYFYGFMILLENQYGVNDVVRIAGIAGLVERITLRLTVLRDGEGTVHFVPHGEVKTVSNMTHGWARAMFDIGIAYSENPDRVMDVLMKLGRELRADPKFGEMILDDPEMLGVESLGDSSVVIRFQIKTGPMQRWPVRREMLRRIKHKFDELQIEIPFPSRTVYYRQAANDQTESPDA